MNISLTDKAANRLKEIIAAKGENLALRVMVRPGGCSGYEYGMALERSPRADDNVTEMDGLKVVVDSRSVTLLDGCSIDYVDSLMGGGFAINNPNASSSCGCGQSFKAGDGGAPKQCGSGGCSH